MTHRYNTRFQAKKEEAKRAAESNFIFAREPLFATITVVTNMKSPIHHTVSSEKDNEIKVIQPLLVEADKLPSRFHRITAALRLFHYLEHHHYLLRNYKIFRESTLRKIEEFIGVVKEDQKILDTLQISQDTHYKEMCRNTAAAELLMDSCIRVRTIIQNF
jgi:hypothetical protein